MHTSEEETSGWKKFGIKQEEILAAHAHHGGGSPRAFPAKSDAVETEQRVKKESEKGDESEGEDNPFSQYYGMLLHQQNMLQDHVRTSTYERAMLENAVDFKDKVVLDVGTGSGILAFFALKAGAKRVYAVELSGMADCAREIMTHNGLSDRIVVIKGKMETVELPEQVDVVISEPMGFFLVHERMLETFVNAGKKWRRANSPAFKMFPSIGTMFVSPFSDETIYREQMSKVAFWQQRDFYGLDLSAMRARAVENHFSQPVVGYFPSDILMSATPVEHVLDFKEITNEELNTFDIPFRFAVDKTGMKYASQHCRSPEKPILTVKRLLCSDHARTWLLVHS